MLTSLLAALLLRQTINGSTLLWKGRPCSSGRERQGVRSDVHVRCGCVLFAQRAW